MRLDRHFVLAAIRLMGDGWLVRVEKPSKKHQKGCIRARSPIEGNWWGTLAHDKDFGYYATMGYLNPYLWDIGETSYSTSSISQLERDRR